MAITAGCTWIIPFGFTAFYPAMYCMEHDGYETATLMTLVVVAAVMCVLSYLFWKRGLRAFTSTGS